MAQNGVPHNVPRPPSYAWDWLQRSRPVLQALSQRLTGQAPAPGFLEELRAAFDEDPFVHAVIVDTIADVAFAGRVPSQRPAGVTWDRGLSWWAATLAGTTRRDFERGTTHVGEQARLFPAGSPAEQAGTPASTSRRAEGARSAHGDARPDHAGDNARPRPSAVVALERRRLANALRALIASSGGGDIPADAVRQLIHDLESLE